MSRWLNWENPSEISEGTRFWIERINDSSLALDEKKQIIQSLVNSIGGLDNPLEQAEILVFCASQNYQIGTNGEAITWLQPAANLYEYCRDAHRWAVTLWMLYIVHRGVDVLHAGIAGDVLGAAGARRILLEYHPFAPLLVES